MSDYKLGTARIEGAATPVVLVNGKAHTLASVLGEGAPATLEAVFADWPRHEAEIAAACESISGDGRDPETLAFETPIANPRKLVCIGTNYHDHLEEMKVTHLPEFPYGFMRPQTCLAAHREEIPLPEGAKMYDWEAELGIVMGRRYGPSDKGDPLEAVAGYTVLNDLSARDWIHNRPFVGIDWVMQKSWDKFQPTGPWITPARYVADPGDLDIELTVNGVVKQKSNTGRMIFSVADILRHLAGMMTLEPGDIIATGTPAGVGFGRDPQEFLKPGDVTRVTVEGLGTLENTFV
ncbi:fumarylacetoacetate hydrolase family protein [Salipiger abyssi]|uniref:2-keto-4-pentenoate hydratase/2-oxohepta-3-ene-1,7-dioic acid hydratase n=1 Tax=Salipiger abyssi TaxID=1250539 RepID=A0A1P8UME5_9RHOB|nr:fumarylacetoacetate hydrolase family protein [Salipiger abyssi]APZ50545.1 2-keto-4-pentenoate hydratase/2-oxohepta-3-ene-1,7-dioic acid hydratase [Salipiger abyssi]